MRDGRRQNPRQGHLTELGFKRTIDFAKRLLGASACGYLQAWRNEIALFCCDRLNDRKLFQHPI
jgi:hypothetical protein